MRKIKLFESPETIQIDSSSFVNLVIENKTALFHFLSYCNSGFAGETELVSYFIDDVKEDNDKSLYFIPDLFSLDLNTKRNINGLYKLLKKKYYSELKEEIGDLRTRAESIVKTIAADFDVELSVGEGLSEDDLFKAMDLEFLDSDASLVNKFIKYVFIVHELQDISVFLVFRMHDFFETNEIVLIRHELDYRGIVLIDIETRSFEITSENESRLIIDKDLCSI